MAQITNEAQWSESRVKMLRECRRKYYLNYFQSWNGWLNSAPLEKKMAYTLKKMSSIPMWTGSVIHDSIEAGLRIKRSGGTPKLQDMEDAAIQALRKGWIDSTQKRWEACPSKALNLFEHYYKVEVPQEKVDGIKLKVLRCLRNLWKSEIWSQIMGLGTQDLVALEEFQSFTMKTGERVSVKIDCGFKKSPLVKLLDWKTGKASAGVIDQLVTYGMYALKMGWVKRLDDLRIVPVYLDTENGVRSEELSVTMEMCARQASIIQQEYPLLMEADNLQGDINRFPVTDNQHACKFCNFKGICSGANAIIGEGVTPF